MTYKTPNLQQRSAIIAVALLLLTVATPVPVSAIPLTGALFTTDSSCTGVDLNIYASKDAVYLDGGPRHPGAAGLPDGLYYVKVTEPDGTLLGTTVGAANETPVQVVGGEFVACYQLSAILIKASDSTPGYDTTSNPGGEYKVWISPDSGFVQQKTDNFKVKGEEPGTDPVEDPPRLRVVKFYDANANGINDDGQPIVGWRIDITDGSTLIRFTPVDILLDPDTYTVTEGTPLEGNWIHTTPTSVQVTLAEGDDVTVEFGNVCLGGGGGHTLGFWSNKNGKATLGDGPCVMGDCFASELALLSGLCLRTAGGGDFTPTSYTQLRTWLLDGNAVNMAYMLSVQLAAMQLNVEAGFVDGDALVYAPDVPGASVLGFISIDDLIAQANAALCADGETLADDPNRATQEDLKDALDAANNNQIFVQASPCPFTFPETE